MIFHKKELVARPAALEVRWGVHRQECQVHQRPGPHLPQAPVHRAGHQLRQSQEAPKAGQEQAAGLTLQSSCNDFP